MSIRLPLSRSSGLHSGMTEPKVLGLIRVEMQVLYSVVRAHPVLVVHALGGFESAPNGLLHDEAVLHHDPLLAFLPDADADVSLRGDAEGAVVSPPWQRLQRGHSARVRTVRLIRPRHRSRRFVAADTAGDGRAVLAQRTRPPDGVALLRAGQSLGFRIYQKLAVANGAGTYLSCAVVPFGGGRPVGQPLGERAALHCRSECRKLLLARRGAGLDATHFTGAKFVLGGAYLAREGYARTTRFLHSQFYQPNRLEESQMDDTHKHSDGRATCGIRGLIS